MTKLLALLITVAISVFYSIDSRAMARPTLYAVNYGVTCNGSTNDTQALNNALDATSVQNGTLILPTGVCLVGGAFPVHVPSNVWLEGQGIWQNGTGTILQTTPNDTRCASNPSVFCGLLTIGGDGQVPAANVLVENLSINAGEFQDVYSFGILINYGASNIHLQNLDMIHIPQFGIAANATTGLTIENCIISKSNHPINSAGRYMQIEAILVSASAPSSGVNILNNTVTGAGFDLDMANSQISGNTIQNFTFGSGITTEQSSNCYNLQITYNTVSGGYGYDVNNTVASGFEQWCPNSTIAFNTAHDNAADGFSLGGLNQSVLANAAYDNSRYSSGMFNGITARYGHPQYNASGSIFSFNHSYNTQGSAGPQSYGYDEQNNQLSNLSIMDNNFGTNKNGSTHILNGSTISSSLEATPCTLVNGTCTTDVSWNTSSNAKDVNVYVSNSANPASWAKMASGSSGSAKAPWIENLTYYFQLRAASEVLGTLTFQPAQ